MLRSLLLRHCLPASNEYCWCRLHGPRSTSLRDGLLLFLVVPVLCQVTIFMCGVLLAPDKQALASAVRDQSMTRGDEGLMLIDVLMSAVQIIYLAVVCAWTRGQIQAKFGQPVTAPCNFVLHVSFQHSPRVAVGQPLDLKVGNCLFPARSVQSVCVC